MKFEQMVLGLLSWRPFSGYELGKYLEREGRFFRSTVHLSQIYRTLSRMVDSGSVSFTVAENAGRPDSKLYQLTDQGAQELREWVNSPYVPSARFQDPEFKARFLLGGPFGRDGLVKLVQTELDTRRAEVVQFRDRDRDFGLLAPIPGVDDSLVRRLTDLAHEHGVNAMDQWISWLETVLAEITDGSETWSGSNPVVGADR